MNRAFPDVPSMQGLFERIQNQFGLDRVPGAPAKGNSQVQVGRERRANEDSTPLPYLRSVRLASCIRVDARSNRLGLK